jgi:hypothetical protein
LLGFLVIASVSEAIHGDAQRKNGLLRRSAPLRKRFAFVAGNDVGHKSAISPRIRASFASNIPPSDIRGRRECRAPDAPAAARGV